MAETFDLSQNVETIAGVGEKVAVSLKRLGITTVADLIEYLPFRLEDRSRLVPIKDVRAGEEIVIKGFVKNVHQRKSKRGITMIQATIEDESGSIPALWFNQRFVLRFVKPGQTLLLYGSKKVAPTLGNPFFVKAIINEPEILPVYRSTKGLYQALLRRIIRSALSKIGSWPEIMPDRFEDKRMLLASCHLQPTVETLAKTKQYLAEEELLLLGLALVSSEQSPKVPPLPIATEVLQEIVSNLPYTLTEGQRKAAWEIIGDLRASKPMRRLLYGEVGSGKTIVALLVAATVAAAGKKVAILLPTTTLAYQQANVAKKILSAVGQKVALLTSEHKDDLAGASIIIGTHALLQEKVKLENLGLLIIDEQQRFGVEQRSQLIANRPDTHLLMMTATPIPRSLAHILFGQMSISYLRGRPAHQKPVETIVFTANARHKIDAAILERLGRGEPGYVICPLIEKSDEEFIENLLTSERKTVEDEAKRLAAEFPNTRIGVIHGRLKAAQKDLILQRFRDGLLDILVATTVIEVGIDNPNATWILIEEADCFGLSQLHQLRGRVGRGDRASICYLSCRTDATDFGKQRLAAISQTNDGLALAEADLQLRGPGELVGVEQSGLPRLRYANYQQIEMVKEMFALAKKISHDKNSQTPNLAAAVKRFQEKLATK